MLISAIVLTKNEEKNIQKCLESLRWCNELIVIDDFSDDCTVKIAKKYKAKIFKRKLNEDFSSQRNFGLQKAQGEWVLFLDADEIVTKKLQKEILEVVKNTDFSGFYLKRLDFIWGKSLKHGEVGRIKLLRLARKTCGTWKRRVHEYWEVKGKIGNLRMPIHHYPHQNLDEFISSVNWMSSLHAEANNEEDKKSSVLKIIFWPLGKFVKNFFLKLGFLDGTPGFVASWMMSLHSFLAWSKLWIYQRQKV